MKIKNSYNLWANTYDGIENKTRDLEEQAAKSTLGSVRYTSVLELGCGTGKNTEWLKDRAESLIGLDFSGEMLALARSKISSDRVKFISADINNKWAVDDASIDLISCSLTLEHVSNLDFIFSEANKKLKAKGHFYIGELHPFKQYKGSKARFNIEQQEIVLDVFTHNISEYIESALKHGFTMLQLKEWFDDNNKVEIPRIISFLFKKDGK